MFCFKCGNKCGDTEKFCAVCGAKIIRIDRQSVPTPESEPNRISQMEQEHLEKKRKIAEQRKRLEEEQRRLEEEEKALEAMELAKKQRLEEERRKAEQKRLEEERRREEEKRRLEEQKKIEEQRRLEDEKWLEEEKRIEEQRRLEDEKRKEEFRKITERRKKEDEERNRRLSEESEQSEQSEISGKTQITSQSSTVGQSKIFDLSSSEDMDSDGFRNVVDYLEEYEEQKKLEEMKRLEKEQAREEQQRQEKQRQEQQQEKQRQEKQRQLEEQKKFEEQMRIEEQELQNFQQPRNNQQFKQNPDEKELTKEERWEKELSYLHSQPDNLDNKSKGGFIKGFLVFIAIIVTIGAVLMIVFQVKPSGIADFLAGRSNSSYDSSENTTEAEDQSINQSIDQSETDNSTSVTDTGAGDNITDTVNIDNYFENNTDSNTNNNTNNNTDSSSSDEQPSTEAQSGKINIEVSELPDYMEGNASLEFIGMILEGISNIDSVKEIYELNPELNTWEGDEPNEEEKFRCITCAFETENVPDLEYKEGEIHSFYGTPYKRFSYKELREKFLCVYSEEDFDKYASTMNVVKTKGNSTFSHDGVVDKDSDVFEMIDTSSFSVSEMISDYIPQSAYIENDTLYIHSNLGDYIAHKLDDGKYRLETRARSESD